jgi:putative ABC transport system permease protein
LLVNSFERLRAIDPGFNTDKVLTCQVSLPSKYKDPQIVTFFQQLLERVRALPGVKAAGATMTLPLRQTGGGFWSGLNIEGRPAAKRESIPIVSFVQVTPGYFRAMDIPLLKGREFNEVDNSDQSPKVAIINATLARRFFSNGDPVGKRICLGENCSKGPWLSVVGVVADAALESLTDPRFPQVFSPHAQGMEGGVAGNMELAVRTSSAPLSLAAAVRNAVHEVDKDQSVAKIQTLGQIVSASLAQPRLNTLLLAGFALLALLLAAVGIYGVISYSVALRTREIGLRMALGAGRTDVMRLVVRQGMILALAGASIGLVGALILMRLMSSLLYGVRPSDPPTFLAALGVLVGVALFASYIPARRAAKVDPMVALRQE